jgi:hypothetical protein
MAALSLARGDTILQPAGAVFNASASRIVSCCVQPKLPRKGKSQGEQGVRKWTRQTYLAGPEITADRKILRNNMGIEIFYCADCNASGLNSEVQLNKRGRCELCDGDNVAPLARFANHVEPHTRVPHKDDNRKDGTESLMAPLAPAVRDR